METQITRRKSEQYISLKPNTHIDLETQPKQKGNSKKGNDTKRGQHTRLNNRDRNNENANTINIKPKQQQKKSKESSHKFVKSKSMARLCSKTDRVRGTPSREKDPHTKPNKNKSPKLHNRSPKEKKKAPSWTDRESHASMQILKAKPKVKSHNVQKNHNKLSIKTELSSKMPSVIKETKLKRKSNTKSQSKLKTKRKADGKKPLLIGQKTIVFSEVSFEQKKSKDLLGSEHEHREVFYLPYSLKKNIKTQGNHYEDESDVECRNVAATMIQRCFRGYLTRKYLHDIKRVIYSAITIQRIWRGYSCRKQLSREKPKPTVSVENSLVTIKDFNDSENKRQLPMPSEKVEFKLILEYLLEEDSISPNIKEKIKATMEKNAFSSQQKQNELGSESGGSETKQVYVSSKINNEILSEKNFNSPKQCSAMSPRISPISTRKLQNEFQLFHVQAESKTRKIDPFQSPRQSPRVLKPFSQVSASRSKIGTSAEKEAVPVLFNPIETDFSFIEEFCLMIIDYLREDEQAQDVFMYKLMNMKHQSSKKIMREVAEVTSIRTLMRLPAETNTEKEELMFFSAKQRLDILDFSSLRLYLNENGYHLQGNELEDSYIKMIFDCFEEALVKQFEIFNIERLRYLSFMDLSQDRLLFQQVLAEALFSIHEWAFNLCGRFSQDLSPEELQVINGQRIIEMVNKQEVPKYDPSFTTQKLKLAELVFRELVDELSQDTMFQ